MTTMLLELNHLGHYALGLLVIYCMGICGKALKQKRGPSSLENVGSGPPFPPKVTCMYIGHRDCHGVFAI